MKYKVIVEGSFETELEVSAENYKMAKIIAAEKFLTGFPKPTSFHIEMVSTSTGNEEEC